MQNSSIRTLTLPSEPRGKFSAVVELGLVFLLFMIQGAWPVPDVNEPYYVTKAMHFWNPDAIEHDFFLNSADSHTVFYFTFGWLTLFLTPDAVAWTGRLLTWFLQAYTWRRLSLAVLPQRWWSVLTAAVFLCLLERCHMAGEWVVGGIEAKGFAYVLVFLGLEQLARNRWNRTWLCFGAAAFFHVLVGGWAVAAAAVSWVLMGRSRPKLLAMWRGLLVGGLLSLPGLASSLRLTGGVDPETVALANQIYVFLRIPHHLDPFFMQSWFVARFFLLSLFWLLIWVATYYAAEQSTLIERPLNLDGGLRIHGFVAGSLVIVLLGAGIAFWGRNDPAWAAGLLRFYWFRLADAAVPLGVALGGVCLIAFVREKRPVVGRRWLVLTLIVVTVHFGNLAVLRARPGLPRADRLPNYACWLDACRWIDDPENVPPGSVFLTPRGAQTFKWHASRGEVVNWKEIPQDARSIVEWWSRMKDVHALSRPVDDLVKPDFCRSLTQQGEKRLKELGHKYGASYVITESQPRLDLPVVYENSAYAVYRLE